MASVSSTPSVDFFLVQWEVSHRGPVFFRQCNDRGIRRLRGIRVLRSEVCSIF